MQGVLDLRPRGLNHLGRVDPAAVDRHRTRVESCHVENVLKQPRQPLDFGQDQRALFTAILLTRPG